MTTETPRKSRSGSRAPKDPKTKAQRLLRVKELTARMKARLAEVDDLAADRDDIVRDLRTLDHATFREIAAHAETSEQAIHKAFQKRTRAAG